MEAQRALDQFQAALLRWRESCVFYFRFDLALIAAAAALLSYFRIEGDGVFHIAVHYRIALFALVLLLIYALILEKLITSTANRPDLPALIADDVQRARLHRIFNRTYAIQAHLHIVLLCFGLGYVTGFGR